MSDALTPDLNGTLTDNQIDACASTKPIKEDTISWYEETKNLPYINYHSSNDSKYEKKYYKPSKSIIKILSTIAPESILLDKTNQIKFSHWFLCNVKRRVINEIEFYITDTDECVLYKNKYLSGPVKLDSDVCFSTNGFLYYEKDDKYSICIINQKFCTWNMDVQFMDYSDEDVRKIDINNIKFHQIKTVKLDIPMELKKYKIASKLPLYIYYYNKNGKDTYYKYYNNVLADNGFMYTWDKNNKNKLLLSVFDNKLLYFGTQKDFREKKIVEL
jgi:hypothetical protein